jgi:hypothetical protein
VDIAKDGWVGGTLSEPGAGENYSHILLDLIPLLTWDFYRVAQGFQQQFSKRLLR